MRRFAALLRELDASTSTARKVSVLARWFAETHANDPASAAWAAYALAGGRLRRAVASPLLRAWAADAAGLDDWLFEACYAAAGDLAETIAHLLPDGAAAADGREAGLAEWMTQRIAPLRGLPPAQQRDAVLDAWRALDAEGRFAYLKLVGGGFRIGVSRLLVQRAIGQAFDLDPKRVAERMMGFTDARQPPTADAWRVIVAPDTPDAAGPRSGLQPYPFFLAHPLDREPSALGAVDDWIVEWKYDGIRAQVVKRDGVVAVWTRGEELATDRFPEVVAQAQRWRDGTVVDGELLAWRPGTAAPASFALLQRRIGRRAPSPRLLRECPVVLRAYDLLEDDGLDIRDRPLHERRRRLQRLAQTGAVEVSPTVPADEADGWASLAAARDDARRRGVEGLMLKQRDGAYGIGRTRDVGLWWKWKVDPLAVDAVLVYAQAGHGRRANLHTDYTFAVWNRAPAGPDEAEAVRAAIALREPAPEDPLALRLVPFAKAYSGLTDDEFREVDRIVRRTTVETFGPVRSVEPSLLFEIGFEGLQPSPRHKSGIATRFPRMLRIRHDKPLWQADTLATLRALMVAEGSGAPAVPEEEGQSEGPAGEKPAGP